MICLKNIQSVWNVAAAKQSIQPKQGFWTLRQIYGKLLCRKSVQRFKKGKQHTHIEVNFQFTSVNKTINLQVRFITQAQLKNTRQPKALCEQSFRMWAKPGDLSYLLGRFYFGRGK
jgi:hypothetical protein